jgi:hypothetical protein
VQVKLRPFLISFITGHQNLMVIEVYRLLLGEWQLCGTATEAARSVATTRAEVMFATRVAWRS